jgi:putative tryptophan/tyrosine transport system substrate-binding protein
LRRRDFISLIGSTVTAWPLAARAQRDAGKIPVAGVLWHAASAEDEGIYLSVLRQALSDLGYVEGRNIVLDHRFPAENLDRFRSLARELVDARPDAIIAVTALGAVELKKLTSAIPIVFVLVPDPIGFGLVDSLAHPGGNATGLSLMATDLSGKRLELLKQAVPTLSRVGLLIDPTDSSKQRTMKANQAAAETLGIALSSVEIATPDDVEPAFARMSQDRADGVVFGTGSILFNLRERIGASAIAHRLPAVTYVAEEVPYGLLLSYGQDFPDYFRRAAAYVDKILKGAKPADLPVEQPTRFKLVLNQRAAKALGLTFPQTLLATADEVIEQ